MLSPKKSLDILRKTKALLDGHFVLSSGLHSPKYVQCAKLLSYPHLADKICKSLAYKIRRKFRKIDLILSLQKIIHLHYIGFQQQKREKLELLLEGIGMIRVNKKRRKLKNTILRFGYPYQISQVNLEKLAL